MVVAASLAAGSYRGGGTLDGYGIEIGPGRTR